MGTQAASKVLGRRQTLLSCDVASHVRCCLDRNDSRGHAEGDVQTEVHSGDLGEFACCL